MLTVTVTYAPLNTDVTQVQTFVYGGAAMIYACCNENRKAAVLGNPDAQRHRLSRGAGPRRDRRGSPRQQTLLVHCLKPAPAT